MVDCQKKAEASLNNSSIEQNQGTKKILLALQEALITCISKTPSDQGFPFNLPDVDFVAKLVLSNSFLNYFLDTINKSDFDDKTIFIVQDIKNALEEFLASGILDHVREIKLLNTNFVKLRKILDDDESSSQQIKEKVKLFRKQLSKHQTRHPKLEVISERLEMYWKNLFYCYDDKRIPRTNNDIEKSFNALKRIKRKRTGRKDWPTFFTHEGRALAQIGNKTSENMRDLSENRFITAFKPKILLVGKGKLETQSLIRENDKLFFNYAYQKKISVQDAGKKFQKLKAQINEI